MYLICKGLSMQTGQTGLPPNQPISLKMKKVHNFGIFLLTIEEKSLATPSNLWKLAIKISSNLSFS